MGCFTGGKKKPKVRAHHLDQERLTTKGEGGSIPVIPGCGTLSTILAVGKGLLAVKKIFDSNNSSGTKDAKAPKTGTSKYGPSLNISVFCGWTKSKDPNSNVPPSAPGDANPTDDSKQASPTISIPLPKWPFSATSANASSVANPSAPGVNAVKPRRNTKRVVVSQANPTAVHPPVTKAEGKLTSSTQVSSVTRPSSSVRLTSVDKPIKANVCSTHPPKLRDMPPHLVIQPCWRTVDEVPEESDELRDDEGEIADEEFLDSESTLYNSSDERDDATPPLAAVSASSSANALGANSNSTTAVHSLKEQEKLESATHSDSMIAETVCDPDGVTLAEPASELGLEAPASSATDDVCVSNPDDALLSGRGPPLPPGTVGIGAPVTDQVADKPSSNKRRKLNKKQRLRARKSSDFVPPDFVTI